VGQPPFQAVIGLVPFQHLELGLKLTSGLPLRRAKQCNLVRGQRQGVSIEPQPCGHDLFTLMALDQQLGG
jgi:hypothetical protein